MRLWVALGIAVGMAPVTAAADPGDFGAPGFYVGAGGSFTRNELIEDQIDEIVPPGVDVDVDDSWAARGLVGYRLLPWFAAEIEYEYVGSLDVSAFGAELARLRADVVTANLKTILPLWRTQPYLLIGIGGARWHFDDELGVGLPSGDTALVGRLGVGVDLHLTRRLVLDAGADVVLSNSDLDTGIPGVDDVDFLGYVTAGVALQYRFTGP